MRKTMRKLIGNITQWYRDPEKLIPEARRENLNFRRIWLLSFLLTSGFAIIPVIFFAVIDYNVTQHSVISDAFSRTSRLTSNTWRSIAFFLNERQNALKYIVNEDSFDDINNTYRLSEVLENLRSSFGGFTDLGVIDASGLQGAYVGPYPLTGKNYSGQPWFENVLARGRFISDVFLGFRNVPHLVIAIKHESVDGKTYALRATIEHQLTHILSEVKTASQGDAFLVNRSGVLQTPSHYFGQVLERIAIPVPDFSDGTEVIEWESKNLGSLMVGYRHIPDTPFILMVVKNKSELMAPWRESRMVLIRYLAISITIILLWIMGITTYLIRRLKLTDKRRVKYLHMAEYSNKLASIGRLAAGVAHEINNPLAIINEKAGLVKDIFHFKKEYQQDPKLIEAMDSILGSVERCGRITRQLLSFARHMNVSIQKIDPKKLVNEVVSFLAKEAEYRDIDVVISVPEDMPEIESDRGKMQQILLNIINNAFAAMKTGGQVKVVASIEKGDSIRLEISDTGCGIPTEAMKYIFEPFFSTRTDAGGTGLGLSITYSLVQELNGKIDVQSEVGKGTTFVVTIPMKPKKEELIDACTAS